MADSLTSIPGVSSGIDWSAVVDSIIAAEKRPAARLQATIAANGKKKDALELFRQALSSLQSAADGLRNGKALDAFSVAAVGADATGRGVLAATVGTGAIGGTYAVKVTALAAAQKTVATTGWTGAQTLATGGTLTLGAKGESTVTVERQPNAGATTMQAFVDAYNKVQAFVKGQGATGSPLQNDPLLRSVRSGLANLVLTPAARVDDSGVPTAVVDDMTSLGALGVAVQKDGTLTFDRAKFDAVYPSRMQDVRAVLSDRMTTAFRFADELTGTYTGQIDKRELGMTTQNATLQGRIDEFDSRLAKKRTALLARYAKFEASLGTLKSLGEQMAAQFSGLNKSSDS